MRSGGTGSVLLDDAQYWTIKTENNIEYNLQEKIYELNTATTNITTL